VPTVEDNRSTEVSAMPPAAVYEQQQRSRMLVALAVLLVALILVVVKDRQFWVPSSPASESETVEPSAPVAPTPVAPATVSPPVTPTLAQKSAEATSAAKHSKPLHHPAATHAPAKSAPDTAFSITATNRAVLPPLEVEVVAGNQHQTIASANNPVSVELQPGTPASPGQAPALAQGPASVGASPNAVAKVELSPGTAQIVSRPVDPRYPLLAKQMKVQGAVILQALISKTGSIQDIQVLSGPAILSAAAREAVQQWRFKPYYQAGRPVETEARITVNFTISTY